MEKVEFIARIAHQCWCGYQLGAGQEFNLEPTPAQHDSQMDGVVEWLKNPDMTSEENHENWVRYKEAEGWVYAPVKDVENKNHPDLVPFDQLPEVERLKDDMDIQARRFALMLWNQVGEPKEKKGMNKCPKCGKPTWQENDCLQCRVWDLREFVKNHIHDLPPVSVDPGMMVGMARVHPMFEGGKKEEEVLEKNQSKTIKMVDGQYRYVMDANTSPTNEDGSRTEIFTCPNCEVTQEFKLEHNEGVDLPVVCVNCTPIKPDTPDGEPMSNELQIGDLIVKKSHPNIGGFDIYVIDPQFDESPPVKRRACFFNNKGTIALKEWIEETHIKPDTDTPDGEPMVGDGPIRIPRPGEHVLYWDHDGQEHDALVIRVFTLSEGKYPLLNLLFVDERVVTPDGYVHTIRNSIEHESVVEIHRNCWS